MFFRTSIKEFLKPVYECERRYEILVKKIDKKRFLGLKNIYTYFEFVDLYIESWRDFETFE